MASYAGGCQCGAVRYRVELDLSQPITCNCSRCQKLGAVLAFAPRAAFVLDSGEDAVSEYLFNRHAIHHRFCRTCGIQSYSVGTGPDGAEMVAINVNCLDGVDPREIARNAFHHDGRSA
ncbi:MAG TPA: GFA family protein [Paracoccaceae bacterium]|nr:GFA family protein [Paracoccaceae bacterium]HMO71554.1 GFA family protein [Paracoccaceae bacterium]